MKDKVLSMAGMARRMRKVSAGGFMTEKAIKSGWAKLIIIAADASDKTKKSIKNSCEYYDVPYMEYSDMFSLGKCIGTEARAVISVNDENIAKAISESHSVSAGKGDEYGRNDKTRRNFKKDKDNK